MKTLIYLFLNTPTASEMHFDFGSAYSFIVKKTAKEYVLHWNGHSDDLVSVAYNYYNTVEEVALLFIRTVEVVTGVQLNS